MSKFIDLTGKRFNRWLVLERSAQLKPGSSRWRCQCDCGTIKNGVLYTSLTRGVSQSCGCLRAELLMKDDHLVHSQRNPVYSVWQGIKTRCFNTRHPSFQRYGAVGITMAEEWRNDFEAFRKAVGPRPEGSSLDRIDNTKGYFPGNVRWATRCEQAGNTKRNIKVSWRGWICNLIDVARMEDVFYPTLRSYFLRHGSIHGAVNRCKELGSRFEERSEEKMGKLYSRRKFKPMSKLEKLDSFRVIIEPENPFVPQVKEPEPPKVTEVRRKDNQKRWDAMAYCVANNLTYRGPMPVDFFEKMHSVKLPKLKKKPQFTWTSVLVD